MRNSAEADSGAASVNWVVLTAALVGLGLAIMGIVRAAMSDMSGDIQGALGGMAVVTAFERVFGTDDFEDGSAPDWTGGEVRDIRGSARSWPCPGTTARPRSISTSATSTPSRRSSST